MKQLTFEQVLDEMAKCGCNCADVALGRMMDLIEEQTGKWPSWDDVAPEWVLKACGIKLSA